MSTPFDAPTITPATDAQVIKIASLLAERDWRGGGKRYVQRAAALNTIISCAMRPMAESTPPSISRLINTHAVGGRLSGYGTRINAVFAMMSADANGKVPFYGPLTKEGASKLIDLLVALPVHKAVEIIAAPVQPEPVEEPQEMALWAPVTRDKAADLLAVTPASAQKLAAKVPAAQLTDGLYVMADGNTVKVQEARNGSGRLYAKMMRLDGTFEYTPGLVGKLAASLQHGASHRMTREEATQYGALYGRCIECGRTLTDEDSIAAGIGPICAGKYA